MVDFSSEKSTVVLLDTGTPGTSSEIYSEDAEFKTMVKLPYIKLQIYLSWKTITSLNCEANFSKYQTIMSRSKLCCLNWKRIAGRIIF